MQAWQRSHRAFVVEFKRLAAMSIVEYLSQLERVVCPPPPPPEEGSEGGPLKEPDELSLRKTIIKKLEGYKRQDQAKGAQVYLEG